MSRSRRPMGLLGTPPETPACRAEEGLLQKGVCCRGASAPWVESMHGCLLRAVQRGESPLEV